MVLTFEGWNDAGEAATSAALYVRESICSVPLAELDGEEFLDFTVQRPTVRTDPTLGRVIEWPSPRSEPADRRAMPRPTRSIASAEVNWPTTLVSTRP